MTLLAVRKQKPGADAAIPSAGPLDDAERFARARELRIRYPVEELARWSQALELPSLPDAAAGEVFETMMRHPRFDDDSRDWRAVPYRELDSALDRGLYNEDGRGWPVWKGATFDRYHPDIAPPVYWADPEPVFERITEKYRKKSLDCRIVFRDVVRATDRRTMKACLAPPRIFAMEKSPQIAQLGGTERDTVGLLGMLNSLPLDWVVRRRVETKMSFGILKALPIPTTPDRVADLAGRLSCVDDCYADFASRAGVECGLLTDDERLELEAEIDALVAHAYGLTREQLEVVFADFVEAAVPESYRELVRERFDRVASPA